MAAAGALGTIPLLAGRGSVYGAMSLISLVVTLIVVGVLLWLLNKYVPMDPKIKTIINAVVVIAVVLWLLNVFGVLPAADIKVPRVR